MLIIHTIANPDSRARNLDVLAHHGNHEVEKSDGLNESETKNGVGEELSTHGWVAGNGGEERGENHTDTDTSTTETDGSGTHTDVLGDLDHGGGDLRGVWADSLAADDVAGGSVKDGGGLLALHGLEWGGLGHACVIIQGQLGAQLMFLMAAR